MTDKDHILQLIKTSVSTTAPDATVILYGSYARGDYREDSDIDLLILVNKDSLTFEHEREITYPLYDIGFETGLHISPMVYTKKAWTTHRVTPFYENVNNEGKVI